MTTPKPVTALDRSSLADVLTMCERGRTALVNAASVTEAREVLAAISTLEHAVKVRDMNQEAVVAASILRLRAERRVGELLREQADRGERQGPHRPKRVAAADALPTLADQGLTRDEASTFSRLAAVPAAAFDEALEHVAAHALDKKIAVTREAVQRAIDPESARTPDDRFHDAHLFKVACERVVSLADAAVEAIQWKHFPGDMHAALGRTALLLSLANAREAITRVDTILRRRT